MNTSLPTPLENTDEEVWKTLDGFSSYEISSFGKIRNKSLYLLKLSINCGYYCVRIKNDENHYKNMKMQRLVALCFLDNPDKKKTVNHKDHVKTNNNVNNLEWATMAEQNNHKRKPTKEIQEMIAARAVCRIDKDLDKELESYKSIKLAAQWIFNNKLTQKTKNNEKYIQQSICKVARDKQKTAYGYKWKYCDKNENQYENEVWKDIPPEIIKGTPGYQVSNCGRVKNHKGRITDGFIHDSDYIRITIFPNEYFLHRLAAQVFLLKPDNKDIVNHIDGNKQNAYVSNLEWCTYQENSQHAHNTGLNSSQKKVVQYDLQMNKIGEFKSIKDASIKLNLHQQNIGQCCLKKRKTTGGFIFMLDINI